MAFEGLEVAQGLAETLRDTPFGHFVRGLFGQNLFDAQMGGGGAEVNGEITENSEIAERTGFAEALAIVNKVIEERDVDKPIVLVRTAFGFGSYVDYLLKDLSHMYEAARPLKGLDAYALTHYTDGFMPAEAEKYFQLVSDSMRELEQIKTELESLPRDAFSEGNMREEYALDVHERLARVQKQLADAAQMVRTPLIMASA